MILQAIFMIEVLSAAFVLWLGVYIITRDIPWRDSGPRRWLRPAMLAGYALVLLAVYLYGNAMESISRSAQDYLMWQHATWWGVPIAVTLFLWAVMILTGLDEKRWARYFYAASLICAATLALGIASGFMLDESAIRPRSSLFQPYYTPMKEPFIHFFQPFVLGGLLGGFILMFIQYRTTPRHTEENRRARWLAWGSLAMLLGGIVSIVPPPQEIAYSPKQFGDYLVTLGAIIIAYGIARHNALEHEQLLEHDFWHSSITVAVSVAIYLLSYTVLTWLVKYPVAPVAIVALSVLAVLTQTPYNWGGGVFDRVMLPRWAIAYRSRLVLMRQEPLTAADPNRLLEEVEESFVELVRTVRREEIDELAHSEVDHIFQYTRFDNPDVLAKSKLHQLHVVQERVTDYADATNLPPDALSTDQQAESLRLFLVDAIDGWMVSGQNETPVEFLPGDDLPPEEVEQVILQKKYAEGWSRTEVEHYLHDTYHIAVTGGAYSRHVKEARRHLADAIVDRELATITRQGELTPA